jgi:sulfhydrogenase subunit beta (sulfur reductase)
MNADFVDSGFDLFLSDIGLHYLVLVGTSRGDDIVTMSGSLLEVPTSADFDEYKRRSAERRAAYRTHVELGDLPGILEMEYHSPVWEELGARCLSCGSCSMVCPTCYCFDVSDEVALSGRAGQRVRTWDSCLFKTHALVAGGENFRESRASRVKFRFYHKQRGFVAEYGRPSCVGCGRCAAMCPAGIDIVTVIQMIRGQQDAHGHRDAPVTPAAR